MMYISLTKQKTFKKKVNNVKYTVYNIEEIDIDTNLG